MKFFRITSATYNTAAAAFSGLGASKAHHRWSWGRPNTRAVYCSDALSLACLECLVHIRPLPRIFIPSVYFTVEIPDELIEIPKSSELPTKWNRAVAPPSARNFGSLFLEKQRAVALLLPTAILPEGKTLLLNPLHQKFQLLWVHGPHCFEYDARLE